MRDPMVKVYTTAPISLYNELEAAARDAGIPMTEFIREAIRQKLRTSRA
jgi:post-segregation antitoxin (ccd killing protein)